MDRRIASDCLSGSWLSARTAIEPLQIEAMRRAGELIAVRPEGSREHYYPVWQFDDDWRPLPVVQRLTSAAREKRLPENRLYELLNARVGLAGRGRLADSLREADDDRLLAAVRST